MDLSNTIRHKLVEILGMRKAILRKKEAEREAQLRSVSKKKMSKGLKRELAAHAILNQDNEILPPKTATGIRQNPENKLVAINTEDGKSSKVHRKTKSKIYCSSKNKAQMLKNIDSLNNSINNSKYERQIFDKNTKRLANRTVRAETILGYISK